MSACDNSKVTIENNSDQTATIEGVKVEKGGMSHTSSGEKIKPGETIAPGETLSSKVASSSGSGGDAKGQITITLPYTNNEGDSGIDPFTLDYALQKQTSTFGDETCNAKANDVGSGEAYSVFVSTQNGNGSKAKVIWSVKNN